MAIPASISQSAPTVSTVLVSTAHQQHKGLFERSRASVPPPLAAYHHHRRVSIDQLKAFARCRDLKASFLGAGESCSAAPQLNLRALTQEFRSSEAAKCGCGVPDIAWYPTTHINVVGDSTAGTAGILSGDDGDLGNSVYEMLAFSSTFSSGPCFASFITVFLHMSLESTLSQRAVDLLKGTPPGILPSPRQPTHMRCAAGLFTCMPLKMYAYVVHAAFASGCAIQTLCSGMHALCQSTCMCLSIFPRHSAQVHQ